MLNISVLRAAVEAAERGEGFALLSVISVEGSSPASPGQKMIVFADGRPEGTVGGGSLEKRAAEDALRMLAVGRGGVLTYDLDPSAPASVGSVCGGKATLAVEIQGPSAHLLLCGGGHLAMALSRQCAELGFQFTVVDPRPEMASRGRFPKAREVYVQDPASFLAAQTLSLYTHAVILTHNHLQDASALHALWAAAFPGYIGMVGSRRKWLEVRDQMTGRGVPPEWLDQVRCPVGLPIGARTPEQIAVSIVAEILQRSAQA